MKLKQKIKIHTIYLIFMIIITVPLIIIRIVELSKYTNFESGFYKGPQSLNMALYSIIFIAMAFSFIMSLFVSDKYKIKLYERKNKFLKTMLLIMAVSSLIFVIYTVIKIKDVNTRQYFLVAANIILSLLSVLSYTYIYNRIKIKEALQKDKILIFPAIWSLFQLLFMFLDHMAVSTVNENTLNILRAAALTVFLINFAKIIANSERMLTSKLMIFSGTLASIMGFIVTIPQYIVRICPLIVEGKLGQWYTNNHILKSTPLDFIMTVFTISFIYIYLKYREKKEDNVNKIYY